MYGATSGYVALRRDKQEKGLQLEIQGPAAVIEGCGTNGCEYMTGGAVVILGEVGDNFAAGMTGGMVFVYDPENSV